MLVNSYTATANIKYTVFRLLYITIFINMCVPVMMPIEQVPDSAMKKAPCGAFYGLIHI